ncbi:multidrug resistance protein 4 [Panus rudis PR-1116 ss-1]|nr:multidrug resistance protein 4 [Panus rudis PR-1116 ss-1]
MSTDQGKAAGPSRPETPVSRVSSSGTRVEETAKEVQVVGTEVTDPPASEKRPVLTGGEGESAIPEDVKEEAIENAEEDWAHDARNARNWSFSKKWIMVAIVSLYTLVPPLASSMMAPALPEIATALHITSPTVGAMTLSIFLVTFALGPLILAPLSEIYGRTWILHICNVMSIGFNTGCGFVSSTGALVALRVMAGLSGSAPIAIGGGTISDLFSERERSSAMAIYSLGPLLGPAIGPIASGFITQSVGYKWIFVVIGGLGGVASALGLPFLRETYGPVIRLRIAKKMGDPEKAKAMHPHLEAVHGPGHQLHLVWTNVTRPFILLTRSLTCFLLSFYMALQYGFYYLMFTTFPTLFSTVYGFGPGVSGLAYIGLGLGFLASTLIGGYVGDKIYHVMTSRNKGKGKPEFRLPALIMGSIFPPIGLFWYGWSAQAQIHWIMPILGSAIFGFGMMATYLPIQLYLVDSFQFAASALAAASVFRSMLGFAFPLFGEQMFDAMGYGGGNSLLAGLAIVLGIPFPVWLYFNGEKLRMRIGAGDLLASCRREMWTYDKITGYV